MLGCFSPPIAKEGDGIPSRKLSRAETRREKKHLKLRQKVERQTSSYGTQGVGFSFSGAGFLFPYFAGVAAGLVQLQLITPSTHLAGASAGSLIAANVSCGLSPEEGFESCRRFANDCRANGSRGRLKQALRQHLLDTLPPDAHERVGGRTHVAITQAVPLKRRIVSDWESREDLVDCLVASCHLPRYSDDSLTSPFRGKAHMDGGVLNFIPAIPVNSVMTVGVCCFPRRLLDKLPVKASIKNLSICPDMFEPHDWQYTMKELMLHAFEPGSDTFLRHLYDRGLKDAHLWSRSIGLVRDGSPFADARLNPALSFSPPLHPSVTTIHDSGFDLPSPSSSMQLSSVETSSMQMSSTQTGSSSEQHPSLPLSISSDSTCASFSSAPQHREAAHHARPVDTETARCGAGKDSGNIMCREPLSGMGLPASSSDSSSYSSSSGSSSYSSSASHTYALPAERIERKGGGLPDSSKQVVREASVGSLERVSNPYSDAMEVVSSLSSSGSCELSSGGRMGPAGRSSLVGQVIQEEHDAAGPAAAGAASC